MIKIKTSFFWRTFLLAASSFLIMIVLVHLYFEETFDYVFWIKTVFQTIIFGIFMAFYTKPKPKRITDFNEVK